MAGGTVCSAVGGPRGPIFLPQMLQGDQFLCHRRSGGPILGGGDQLSYDMSKHQMLSTQMFLASFGVFEGKKNRYISEPLLICMVGPFHE